MERIWVLASVLDIISPLSTYVEVYLSLVIHPEGQDHFRGCRRRIQTNAIDQESILKAHDLFLHLSRPKQFINTKAFNSHYRGSLNN